MSAPGALLAERALEQDVLLLQTPALELGGQFVQPVSNTAEVAISGYLVPAS